MSYGIFTFFHSITPTSKFIVYSKSLNFNIYIIYTFIVTISMGPRMTFRYSLCRTQKPKMVELPSPRFTPKVVLLDMDCTLNTSTGPFPDMHLGQHTALGCGQVGEPPPASRSRCYFMNRGPGICDSYQIPPSAREKLLRTFRGKWGSEGRITLCVIEGGNNKSEGAYFIWTTGLSDEARQKINRNQSLGLMRVSVTWAAC